MLKIPIEPMLLMSASKPFDSPDYAFELKFDGVRMLAYRADGGAHLINRRLHERTRVYTEVAEELARLPDGVVLDGEIVAPGPDGRPDFYRILKRDRVTGPPDRLLREIPARFIAFDILYLNGEDVTARPFRERRGRLEALLQKSNLKNAVLCDSFLECGEALFRAAASENLEGIVAKRLDGVYTPGARTDAWIKIKNPKYTRPGADK